jgi:6-phosphofructokinase
MHHYQGKDHEVVLCPGFASGAMQIKKLAAKLHTTNESHQRIMVLEVMGRDAGWLTGSAMFGGAQMALIPEVVVTKERKDFFFETVKEKYMSSPKRSLIIAVSEGVRWYSDEKGGIEMVYASSELDEYGHPRFGGVSGVIASEINKQFGIEARGQISGYIPRSGKCYEYDRRLNSTLADKVVDLLLREEFGKMPVMRDLVPYTELEEFHTSTIEMGNIGNFPLPHPYYDANEFQFSDQYVDFLTHIIGEPYRMEFNHKFPVVIP